jgi:hypothetical protein
MVEREEYFFISEKVFFSDSWYILIAPQIMKCIESADLLSLVSIISKRSVTIEKFMKSDSLCFMGMILQHFA